MTGKRELRQCDKDPDRLRCSPQVTVNAVYESRLGLANVSAYSALWERWLRWESVALELAYGAIRSQ